MPRCRSLVVAVAVAAVALLAPGRASAHRMEVRVGPAADPAALRVDAGYEYGDAAEAAAVTVTREGDEVFRGTTDADGVCTLPRPPAGDYVVIVDDGAGHRVQIDLTVPPSEQELAAVATAKRNRWLTSAAGLALIAGLALGSRRFLRKTPEPAPATA